MYGVMVFAIGSKPRCKVRRERLGSAHLFGALRTSSDGACGMPPGLRTLSARSLPATAPLLHRQVMEAGVIANKPERGCRRVTTTVVLV